GINRKACQRLGQCPLLPRERAIAEWIGSERFAARLQMLLDRVHRLKLDVRSKCVSQYGTVHLLNSGISLVLYLPSASGVFRPVCTSGDGVQRARRAVGARPTLRAW